MKILVPIFFVFLKITVAAKKTPVLLINSWDPKSLFFNELNFQKVSYIYAHTYTFWLKQIGLVVFA